MGKTSIYTIYLNGKELSETGRANYSAITTKDFDAIDAAYQNYAAQRDLNPTFVVFEDKEYVVENCRHPKDGIHIYLKEVK